MTRITTMTLTLSALMTGVLLAQAPAGRGGAAAPTAPAAPQRPATPPATAPAPAAAPAPVPFPADAKIGFVNMQYIVSESRLGKAGQERMKTLTDKQSLDRQSTNLQIQKLQQEIQAGASVLTAAVLSQKNQEIDRLQRQAQFDEQQRQADAENMNSQLLDEFSSKVLPIIEAIRAEKNLWVILTSGADSGIAAVHAGLDLSLEVVKRLDAAPAAAPAAPAPR